MFSWLCQLSRGFRICRGAEPPEPPTVPSVPDPACLRFVLAFLTCVVNKVLPINAIASHASGALTFGKGRPKLRNRNRFSLRPIRFSDRSAVLARRSAAVPFLHCRSGPGVSAALRSCTAPFRPAAPAAWCGGAPHCAHLLVGATSSSPGSFPRLVSLPFPLPRPASCRPTHFPWRPAPCRTVPRLTASLLASSFPSSRAASLPHLATALPSAALRRPPCPRTHLPRLAARPVAPCRASPRSPPRLAAPPGHRAAPCLVTPLRFLPRRSRCHRAASSLRAPASPRPGPVVPPFAPSRLAPSCRAGSLCRAVVPRHAAPRCASPRPIAPRPAVPRPAPRVVRPVSRPAWPLACPAAHLPCLAPRAPPSCRSLSSCLRLPSSFPAPPFSPRPSLPFSIPSRSLPASSFSPPASAAARPCWAGLLCGPSSRFRVTFLLWLGLRLLWRLRLGIGLCGFPVLTGFTSRLGGRRNLILFGTTWRWGRGLSMPCGSGLA
jgi:hypothetical protein